MRHMFFVALATTVLTIAGTSMAFSEESAAKKVEQHKTIAAEAERQFGVESFGNSFSDIKQFMERVRTNPNLARALKKTWEENVRTVLIWFFNISKSDWVGIDREASDDEIINFLCGENSCQD